MQFANPLSCAGNDSMEKELPKAARSILPLCPRHPLDIGAVEG